MPFVEDFLGGWNPGGKLPQNLTSNREKRKAIVKRWKKGDLEEEKMRKEGGHVRLSRGASNLRGRNRTVHVSKR